MITDSNVNNLRSLKTFICLVLVIVYTPFLFSQESITIDGLADDWTNLKTFQTGVEKDKLKVQITNDDRFYYFPCKRRERNRQDPKLPVL